MITNNSNNTKITVGSHVRVKGGTEYLGKVVREEYVRLLTIEDRDGDLLNVHPHALELAPRLEPDQAWAEVTLHVMRYMYRIQSTTLYKDMYRTLRHECYKLLGGAGVKVDETVKERVRDIIQQTADVFYMSISD